jgi:hypothetical protein
MEAKELRIGNWFKEYDEFRQVTYNTIRYLNNNEDESYNPIPLTEEILLKAGFERNGEEFIYYERYYTIGIGELFNVAYVGSDKVTVDCKHVHQLQNLYFALTGEELEIDLNK